MNPAKTAKKQKNWVAYLFVLPYLIFLGLFGLFPAIYAFGLSFFDTTGKTDVWAGLGNYAQVFADPRFLKSVLNVLAFMGIWLPAMALGVIGLSLLLHARPGVLSNSLQMIYYLPGSISSTAAVLLWIFMFDPRISPFGPILQGLGFTDTYSVLVSRNLPAAFAIMAFFSGVGGWVVVVYGSLMSISKEVLEAAIIDGCTDWQLAFRIKLPLVMRNVVFMLILSFAAGFQLFAEPQLLNSANIGVSSNEWSINYLAYSYAFNQRSFGGASAISTVLLVVSLGIALWMIYRTDFYRID